ncbi:unnamed protein product [Malus baccata var. baccata]
MKTTKKPAKKGKTKKKKAKQKKEYIQYRCNMIGFADAMKVYNPMLQRRQEVYDELAKTPFWSLLKTYMDGTLITSERKRKLDMDLIKIINCYNSKNQKFKFGCHKSQGISSDDVVQIFGLKNEGIDLPNTDKSTKFGDDDNLIKKYFTYVKIYCICIHTNLVETIEGRENMILAITSRGGIGTITIPKPMYQLLYQTFGMTKSITIIVPNFRYAEFQHAK